MSSGRVAELIHALALRAHPEGGFYREIWRSPLAVQPSDGRGQRTALTAILFLLPEGEVSRWHRVRSDEVWVHLEGAPIELMKIPPDEWRLERVMLGPSAQGHAAVECVSAQWWQAARSLGAYTLVSCVVGPGFEFADFELLSERQELADRLRRELPGSGALL